MAVLVYTLCALTALLCAYLLLQAYRRGGYRLLLWSGLCFVGLTLNNLLLVLDKLIFPDVDLSIWRTSIALAAMTVLLYGLIWDSELSHSLSARSCKRTDQKSQVVAEPS